jgi:hypothetical protein
VSKHSKRKRRARRPKSTAPQVPPRAPRRLAGEHEERPQAPWHPVPLVELCVFVGVVLAAIGFFTKTRTLLALGVSLAALGGLDTAAREHFGGYRSHTLVLAGVPAIAAAVVAAFAKAPLLVVVPVMVAVFVAALVALRRAWEAKTPA